MATVGSLRHGQHAGSSSLRAHTTHSFCSCSSPCLALLLSSSSAHTHNRYADTYKRRGQARSAMGNMQGALDDLDMARKLLEAPEDAGLAGLLNRSRGEADDRNTVADCYSGWLVGVWACCCAFVFGCVWLCAWPGAFVQGVTLCVQWCLWTHQVVCVGKLVAGSPRESFSSLPQMTFALCCSHHRVCVLTHMYPHLYRAWHAAAEDEGLQEGGQGAHTGSSKGPKERTGVCVCACMC